MDGWRMITKSNRKFLRKIDRPKSLSFPYFEDARQKQPVEEEETHILDRGRQTAESQDTQQTGQTTELTETTLDAAEARQPLVPF